MSYLFQTQPFRSWIQRFRLLLIVSPILLALTSPFLLDWRLKSYLERYGTLLNGAEVNIGALSFSLFRGKVSLQGIQITHHTRSTNNLLEIDEISFDFERAALFSRRLVISQMKIEGIRLNKPREQSGYVDMEEFHPLPPTALMDRIAPGIYDSVRASLGQSPLRNLVQITMGHGARNRIDGLAQEFVTHQEIKRFETQLDQLIVGWDRAAETIQKGELGNDELGISERIQSLVHLRNQIQQESHSFSSQVTNVENNIPIDLERTLAKLGMAPFKEADLTQQLLGKRVLNHLERLAYWVEVSRRRLSGNTLMTAGGPTTSGRPSIEIRNIVLHSVANGVPYQGTISGTITGLSTLPVGRTLPIRIAVEADFPSLNISGIKLNVVVDHTQPTPQEELKLSVTSLPLYQWELENSNDLKLSLATGNGGLKFESVTSGPQVNASWNVKVANAQFEIVSQSSGFNSTLREILSPFAPLLELSGHSSGTLDKIQVHNESAFGKELALQLGMKYQSALRGVEEATRDQLTARFVPALRRLERRIESASSQAQNRLSNSIQTWEIKRGSG